MRLTAYGQKEILGSTLLLGSAILLAIVLGFLLHPHFVLLTFFPAIILVWVYWFFRDPLRQIPDGDELLISPADGVVTQIDEVDEPFFIEGRAKRISIFMNIFSVHVNRVPLSGQVAHNSHHRGKFINAMHTDSSHINEHNDLGLEVENSRVGRLLVRQIAGLIARRIVCPQPVGTDLTRGDIFGMIKFGSRVEVFLPAETPLRWRVTVGEKVAAGSTILGELEE